MSTKETECLDNGHDGKGDTYSRGRLCIDFSDKVSIGHDIERGNQHTDDGRNGQSTDEAWYRCRGHKGIFILGHGCLFDRIEQQQKYEKNGSMESSIQPNFGWIEGGGHKKSSLSTILRG